MTNSIYQVEFDGLSYMVLRESQVLAAFCSCDEAFDAKRSFESKRAISAWEKVPPAMRQAKRMLYS